MNRNQIADYIMGQFKKKMKMEDRDDLTLEIDFESWDYEDYTCEVIERKDNGKVWTIECYSTGRIRNILELGE